jgi:hypothetical protein
MERKMAMTAMLSRAKAIIDHFLNAGGSPSIRVTGSGLGCRVKKSPGFYK